MAISPKNEEKLAAFELELRERGDRLSATEIADFSTTLRSSKLEDGLRASIYLERLHQRDQDSEWDGLIPVDALMATLREEL